MQTEIYSVMYRLVHKYGWNWGITRGLINRQFGTNYTADELKELYRRHFLQRTGAICKREGLVLFHEFFIQKVQIHLKTVFPPPFCLDQQSLIPYIIQQLPERSITDSAKNPQLCVRYPVLRKQRRLNQQTVDQAHFFVFALWQSIYPLLVPIPLNFPPLQPVYEFLHSFQEHFQHHQQERR